MGLNNSTTGKNFISGTDNNILADASSILLGIGNTFDPSAPFGEDSCIIVGNENYVGMAGGMGIFGFMNEVADAGSSIISGNYNYMSATSSMAVGENNYVASGSNAFALGKGLIVDTSASGYKTSTVIGSYNKVPDAGEPRRVFTVGNGTGSATNQRSNALIIYESGQIEIPAVQGDISMGEFAP